MHIPLLFQLYTLQWFRESRCPSLPFISATHLRQIVSRTTPQFADICSRLVIVDCRYKYEYQGGHIPVSHSFTFLIVPFNFHSPQFSLFSGIFFTFVHIVVFELVHNVQYSVYSTLIHTNNNHDHQSHWVLSQTSYVSADRLKIHTIPS